MEYTLKLIYNFLKKKADEEQQTEELFLIIVFGRQILNMCYHLIFSLLEITNSAL